MAIKSFKWLPHVVMYLAVLFLVGLGDIMSGDLQVSTFYSADFWQETTIMYGATIITLLATIDIWITKYNQNNERVASLDKGINYMLDNEVKGDFPVYMTEVNQKRKRVEYINFVNNEIAKLDKKLGNKKNNKWIYYKGTDEQKKGNKYCEKLDLLKRKLTPENVENVVFFSNFKYDKLPDSFIKTGERQNKKTAHGVTIENKFSKIIRDLGPRLILSLTWTLVLASWFFEVESFDSSSLFTTIGKLLLILWNFASAISYVNNTYGPGKILHDRQMRRDTLIEYKLWREKEVKAT